VDIFRHQTKSPARRRLARADHRKHESADVGTDRMLPMAFPGFPVTGFKKCH
jgi:hypothetical protein